MVHTRNNAKRLKTADDAADSVLSNPDVLASIAPYLLAEDLASLASTSSRYGRGTDRDSSPSLIQEAARRALAEDVEEEERAALPKYEGESWLQLYHQLVLLRSPLVFDQLVGSGICYVDRHKSRVRCGPQGQRVKTAISDHVMRAGKHYAEFVLGDNYYGFCGSVGIIRPVSGWGGRSDLYDGPDSPSVANTAELLEGKSERWGDGRANCCMYYGKNGVCVWNDWAPLPDDFQGGLQDQEISSFDRMIDEVAWETEQRKSSSWDGQEGWLDRAEIELGNDGIAIGSPPVLGLLLDLDEGTLTVFKDGRKLGIMKDGLSGEYCWCVALDEGHDIAIRRADIPAASNEES